jgi:hypothetical protein
MVHKKYTEEQIIAVLREGEAGTGVSDLCRKYGMSDATYYNWKAKYAGLTVSELKRRFSLLAVYSGFFIFSASLTGRTRQQEICAFANVVY